VDTGSDLATYGNGGDIAHIFNTSVGTRSNENLFDWDTL
jgi:hypothetical protein